MARKSALILRRAVVAPFSAVAASEEWKGQPLAVYNANGGPEFSSKTTPTDFIKYVDVTWPDNADGPTDGEILSALQRDGIKVQKGDRISWVFQRIEGFIMRAKAAVFYIIWEDPDDESITNNGAKKTLASKKRGGQRVAAPWSEKPLDADDLSDDDVKALKEKSDERARVWEKEKRDSPRVGTAAPGPWVVIDDSTGKVVKECKNKAEATKVYNKLNEDYSQSNPDSDEGRYSMKSKAYHEEMQPKKSSLKIGRIDIKVEYADGNSTVTGFNGTLEEAKKYYVGKKFNFGDTDSHPKDKMVEAVDVKLAHARTAGRKLIKTEGNIKVYWNNEWSEYAVVPADGSEAGTYYTSDKKDAFDTAKSMAKTSASKTSTDKAYFNEVAQHLHGVLASYTEGPESRSIKIKIGSDELEIDQRWNKDGSSTKPVTTLAWHDDVKRLGRFAIWNDPKSYAEDVEGVMGSIDEDNSMDKSSSAEAKVADDYPNDPVQLGLIEFLEIWAESHADAEGVQETWAEEIDSAKYALESEIMSSMKKIEERLHDGQFSPNWGESKSGSVKTGALDDTFVALVKPAIMKTWSAVGSDLSAVAEGSNLEAVLDYGIDQYGGSKDASKALESAFTEFGSRAVLKFLSKHISL